MSFKFVGKFNSQRVVVGEGSVAINWDGDRNKARDCDKVYDGNKTESIRNKIEYLDLFLFKIKLSVICKVVNDTKV